MDFSPVSLLFRRFRFLRSFAAVAVFGVASFVAAAEDPLGDPALATSVDPSSLTVSPEEPESLTVGTQNPAVSTVATTPLPAPVQPQSPGALLAPSKSLSDRVVETRNLEDLPDATAVANGVRGTLAAEVAASALPSSASDSIAEARSELAASQARLDRVNTAIGTMLARDYPTGEARLRLYDEQSAARRAVEEAKQQVNRFRAESAGFAQ